MVTRKLRTAGFAGRLSATMVIDSEPVPPPPPPPLGTPEQEVNPKPANKMATTKSLVRILDHPAATNLASYKYG
jgi:hypothetical protein